MLVNKPALPCSITENYKSIISKQTNPQNHIEAKRENIQHIVFHQLCTKNFS